MKIISGGQTGVDRAALDAALRNGISCGGWCPAGRLAENGRIPLRYPVKELAGGGFDERTRQNVIDSNATVILHNSDLSGGSEYTLQCCREQHRPYLVIDAGITPPDEAAELIVNLIRANGAETLNVAGPRRSEWPNGYNYAFAVLERVGRGT